jgi:hypothetical protein
MLCNRKQFGLALDQIGRQKAISNCSVRATTAANPLNITFDPTCLAHFDFVIVNEFAHWAGDDGCTRVEECLRQQGVPDASQSAQRHVLALYHDQMRRNAAHLREVESSARAHGGRQTKVLFRTALPGYPPAEVLRPDTPGGVPPVFTTPNHWPLDWVHDYAGRAASPYNHHLWARMNHIGRRAYHEHGLGVMDVEPAMIHRVDGHLDRLHYCLPGPPDFFTHALFNYAL